MKQVTVDCSVSDQVVIRKEFGPLIFATLRITADFGSGNWLIERQIASSGAYVPWVTIPGQIEAEFTEPQ